MGEIAEMMLDGTLCEGCGEWFGDGKAPGYARYHKGCRPVTPPPVKKHKCPECGRKVKPTGLTDHIRDAHGVKP